MRLLGYLGWLLRCCYVVAKVPRVLLGYLGWLLRCCYMVAKVPRVLLCGC